MTELWDPERLATAGWIMNRYSDFLRPGDRIRIGQEGDPCSTYRSSEDAPSARVENVEREVDGTVRFRAIMEGSGAVVNLDNRNVASDRIWELHPSQVEEFRARVQNDRTHRGSDEEDEHDDGHERDASETHEELYDERDNRSREQQDGETKEETLTDIFKEPYALEMRVKDMEFRGTEMEKTIGGAIRELTGDLMRIYHGEAPSFSIKFADKYDLALHTDASYKGARDVSEAEDTRHDFSDDDEEPYAKQRGRRSRSSDRHDFDLDDDVPPLASYTDDVMAAHTPDEP